MKKFCYVIVQSDGISHDLWPDWEAYSALDTFEDEDDEDNNAWRQRKTMPELLADGWQPVREIPMGGGSRDGAYALVLLEKDE